MKIKSHECSICDFKTKAKQNLKKHVERVHIASRYKCNICNTELANRFCAEDHKKKNHSVISKTLECKLCEKKFHQSHELKKHHLRVHTKQRPYKCQVCNKSFTHSSHLAVHKRIHTGKKLIHKFYAIPLQNQHFLYRRKTL